MEVFPFLLKNDFTYQYKPLAEKDSIANEKELSASISGATALFRCCDGELL